MVSYAYRSAAPVCGGNRPRRCRLRYTGAWRKTTTTGFTLVELLLVIAIVLLLVAMLMPMAGRSMERARRAGCAGNLRKIGVGTTLHAADHDGYFITVRHRDRDVENQPASIHAIDPSEWEEFVAVGLGGPEERVEGLTGSVVRGSPFTCPNRPNFPHYEPGRLNQYTLGYIYLGGVEKWYSDVGSLGRVRSRSPVRVGTAGSQWVMAADGNTKTDGAWGGGRLTAWRNIPPHRTRDNLPAGGNHLHVDGSVRWVSFDKMLRIHSWWWLIREVYFYQDDIGELEDHRESLRPSPEDISDYIW